VNLRLFSRWNFGFSSIANFMLGFVLYAAVYLIPLYLAEAHGYSAAQAGAVMAWIGLPQLLIIPCMPWLMKRIDPRRLLSFGFLLFFISLMMNLSLGPNDSGPQLLIPNLIRAVGQALVFPPITMIATAGISAADAGSASALFNMLRNLGGAVGIATVETFVTNREKFHSFIINQHVSLLDPATRDRIAAMQQYFQARGMSDPGAARQQAIILLGNTLKQQANYFAYGDAFGLLAMGMLLALAASLFIRRPSGPAAPGGH
jgi:DHA2 family multidrug resistance protein